MIDPETTQVEPELTEQQVFELTKGDLLGLVKHDVDEDVDPEKTMQLFQVRKCHLYYQGKQYLTFQLQGDYLDFTSAVGTPIAGSAQYDEEGDEAYDYIVNIVKGDGRKFVAVVGNRPPNVKSVADLPDDEKSLSNARDADSLAHTLFSWWDIRRLHRYLALQLWTSGTVFGHTCYVADKYKYGTIREPRWSMAPQEIEPAGLECPQCSQRSPEGTAVCPQCGMGLSPLDYREAVTAEVPVQDGFEEYDNGQVELHLYTVLHVTVPFYSRDLEDVPWLRLELEEHKAKLLELYPELEEKLRGDDEGEATTSQSQAISVRQSDSSPTGSRPKRKNLVTYSRYWLRPYMFNLIRDKEKRELLKQFYPDGLMLVRVKDEVVHARNEKLDDVWAYCTSEASDYIYSDPLSVDHVHIQDLVNDLINIGVETLERAVPWMLADPTVVDFKQLQSRARRPAEVVPTVPGTGRSLHESIANAPQAKFSEQTMPFIGSVHETVREIAGVQKAIFGGEASRETTAREYEGRRNQAMMQLTSSWDSIRSFYGKAVTNGVRVLAQYGPRILQDADNPQRMIQLQNVLEKNWHFEVEESIPITPGQKADRLLYLFGQASPIIPTLFGLTHPENAQTINDLLGMEGLHVPGSNEVEAVKDTIRKLLVEQPVPETLPDGTTITHPSITPQWAEDSQLVVAVVKAWALTKAGRYQAESNPEGYMNVIAYGEAHERRLMQQMMPPVPMGAPGAPGPGGPAPGGPGPAGPVPGAPPAGGPVPGGPAPGAPGAPPPPAAPVNSPVENLPVAA